MSWGIDQRRAAEHDKASTAAYISGLRDYGWNGDVDSVKFARATAAALNAGTWLAMEVSWLCPDMAERFGSDALHGRPRLRQSRELAQQPWWSAGLPASTMYLILRTRLASYCRTFIVELLNCRCAAAVPVSGLVRPRAYWGQVRRAFSGGPEPSFTLPDADRSHDKRHRVCRSCTVGLRR